VALNYYYFLVRLSGLDRRGCPVVEGDVKVVGGW